MTAYQVGEARKGHKPKLERAVAEDFETSPRFAREIRTGIVTEHEFTVDND